MTDRPKIDAEAARRKAVEALGRLLLARLEALGAEGFSGCVPVEVHLQNGIPRVVALVVDRVRRTEQVT